MKLNFVPADTSPKIARLQMEIFQRLPEEQRLLQVLRLSDSARALTAAGIRDRHPEYTDEQVRLAVIRLCLGEELFRKAYPNAVLPK